MDQRAKTQTETSGDAEAASPPFLLLIADDLLIPSRIREGCRPLGYAVRVVATEAAAFAILAEATAPPPLAVLVNLTARRYDPNALIRAIKTDERFASLPLLAFAGHVERDKQEAACRAGADRIAANSSVSLHLPVLLARLLSGKGDAPGSPDNEGIGDNG